MGTKTEFWLEVELLHAETGATLYAGNLDELACCSLIGYGVGRGGTAAGIRNHKDIMRPALLVHGYPEDLLADEERVLLFEKFPNENYGVMPYALGERDSDFLRLKLESCEDPRNDPIFVAWLAAARACTFPVDGNLGIRIGRAFVTRKAITSETSPC